MKRDAAEIRGDASALPTDARAALATALIQSLDREVGEHAEAMTLWAYRCGADHTRRIN